MADITLTSLSGGVSSKTFYSATLQVASGASAGDLITITPPSGKRVILVTLMAGALESNITVNGSVEGDVISLKPLAANVTNTVGSFAIGQVIGTTNLYVGAGNIVELGFAINSVVKIKKAGASTGSIIYYSYAYGS